MRRTTSWLAMIAMVVATTTAYALYGVNDSGTWPRTWPAELEPLRKTSRTFVGSMFEHQHFLIPFTNRAEFEAAWTHFLTIKTKGAPIILVRGPKTSFMDIKPAGILIHSPPIGTDTRINPERPLAGDFGTNVREQWMWTTYFELVVDGNIVDLNRIALPPDTPIIDERFVVQNTGAGPEPANSSPTTRRGSEPPPASGG